MDRPQGMLGIEDLERSIETGGSTPAVSDRERARYFERI